MLLALEGRLNGQIYRLLKSGSSRSTSRRSLYCRPFVSLPAHFATPEVTDAAQETVIPAVLPFIIRIGMAIGGGSLEKQRNGQDNSSE